MNKLLLTFLVSTQLMSAEAPKIKGVLFHGEMDPVPGVKIEEFKKNLPMVTVEKRDEAFQKAGLVKEIAKYDQLDRDLLYHRAGDFTKAELIRSFPDLPPKKLELLSKIVSAKHD